MAAEKDNAARPGRQPAFSCLARQGAENPQGSRGIPVAALLPE